MKSIGIISIVVASITGFVVWVANSIAENAITNACFDIIFDMSEYATQYDSVTGLLIGAIPYVLTGGMAFATCESILKQFEN